MDPELTSSFHLSNLHGECELVAAGLDPVFGEVVPDQFSAFAKIRFGTTLPQIVGPEMLNGAVFGMHPAVVARSFQTARFKQMNYYHQLKSMGAKRDRILGCILQVAFPEEPAGGWVIPATGEEAPSITALATIFKQAEGVSDMLGRHLGGKIKMSVSMEFSYYHSEVGIYDPATNITYDRADIPKNLMNFLAEDDKGRLFVRKSVRQPTLVRALGGVSGSVWFSGAGYTDRPADELAGIDSIAATRREGLVVCQVASGPALVPGMQVHWKGGHWGRGRVLDVHYDGRICAYGKALEASLVEPVVAIRLPDGARIIRRASSLIKKN